MPERAALIGGKLAVWSEVGAERRSSCAFLPALSTRPPRGARGGRGGLGTGRRPTSKGMRHDASAGRNETDLELSGAFVLHFACRCFSPANRSLIPPLLGNRCAGMRIDKSLCGNIRDPGSPFRIALHPCHDGSSRWSIGRCVTDEQASALPCVSLTVSAPPVRKTVVAAGDRLYRLVDLAPGT